MEQTLFLRNAGLERLEWSGRKAGESVFVRGRNSAEACASRAGSALAPVPDQALASAL